MLREKSIWLLSLIHYLIGGILPIATLLLLAAPFLVKSFPLAAGILFSNNIRFAVILLILIFYWLATKISAKIIHSFSKVSRRKSITTISAIGLALTIFLLNLFAFYNLQNNLPVYVDRVGFSKVLVAGIEPMLILTLLFTGFSILNLKND